MAKLKQERRPLTWKRLKNLVMGVLGNPFNVIVFISLIVLFCLIVIPLLTMVSNTFMVAKSELRNLPGSEIGDVTLYYWKYLFATVLGKIGRAHV